MKWAMNLLEVPTNTNRSKLKCKEVIRKVRSIQIIKLPLITCGDMEQNKSIKKRKTLRFGTQLLKFQSNAPATQKEEDLKGLHKHQLRLLQVFQSNQQQFQIEKATINHGSREVGVLEVKRRLQEGLFLSIVTREVMVQILS